MSQPNVADLSGSYILDNALNCFSTDTDILILDNADFKFFTPSPLLDSFKNLKTLSAVNCQLRDLEHIPGKETIQKLFLDDNKLSDEALEHLAGFKSLRRLSLAGNGFRYAEELMPLMKLPMLLELDLTNNPIVDDPDFDIGMRFMFRRRLLVDKGAGYDEPTIDDSDASSSSHETEPKTDPDIDPTMDSVEMADLLKKMEDDDPDYEPDNSKSEEDSIMADESNASLLVPNNTLVEE